MTFSISFFLFVTADQQLMNFKLLTTASPPPHLSLSHTHTPTRTQVEQIMSRLQYNGFQCQTSSVRCRRFFHFDVGGHGAPLLRRDREKGVLSLLHNTLRCLCSTATLTLNLWINNLDYIGKMKSIFL